MTDSIKIASSEATDFYPTPYELAKNILEDVNLREIKTVLEPSAGKGDFLKALAEIENWNFSFEVDCIELDSNLRVILKHEFSEEHLYEINNCIDEFNLMSRKRDLTEIEKSAEEVLRKQRNQFFSKGIHIVYDDFLKFETFKTYDLIIMNPPFSCGDKHLLKALKMQENGGNIICILNAETIRNPYTQSRKDLLNLLDEYDATIEYEKNAFSSSERKTDVEIAVIKVSIPTKVFESDIYNKFKKAEKVEDTFTTVEDLEVTDYIKAIVHQFDFEVKCGVELIKQFRAMIPYMASSFEDSKDGWSNRPILRLTDSYTTSCSHNVSINEYLSSVRLKYWKALLSNPKFIGKLTSKLQNQYLESVSKLKSYDFNEFNIYTLSAEMNSKIKSGIEDEIVKMFDRLTEEHSYYTECNKNRHLYDGWKTNKAHKIDKKVIVPCYGVFDSYDGRPRTYQAQGLLEDIERILNFLDGGMTREIDLRRTLDICFGIGETKNIGLKYFKATFYKKGTIHLVFTCPELIERFNIYAAQKKNWLPPNYGKAAYSNMTTEEKAVVDSFQGEEAYNKVFERADYYLNPVVNNQMLMLGSGE